MSDIYLFRHGQASFGAADYDNLSDLGREQARVTGASFRHLAPPARVITGEMRRHVDTHLEFASTYGEMPAPLVDGDWNEYDHEAVVNALVPGWTDPGTRAQWFSDKEHPGRAFQALFIDSVNRWVGGEHEGDYEEPHAAFVTRCARGLDRAVEGLEPDESAFVFTSGGVITSITHLLLRFPPEHLIEVNLATFNAGLTHIKKTRRGLQLVSFNSAHHLAAHSADLVTHF